MKLETAKRILNDLRESAYFASLPNDQLYNALCERLEPYGDMEEDSELQAILCEIASRLPEPEKISLITEQDVLRNPKAMLEKFADMETAQAKYRQALLDIDCLLEGKWSADLCEQIQAIVSEVLSDYYSSDPDDRPILPPYQG